MTTSFWAVFWGFLLWPYYVARAVFYALLDGSDGRLPHFEQLTDNEPVCLEQNTDVISSWGSGATGYYGGSTGYWPPTTAAPMTTMPPPTTPPPPKPKPLEVPDLDAPRVINLD